MEFHALFLPHFFSIVSKSLQCRMHRRCAKFASCHLQINLHELDRYQHLTEKIFKCGIWADYVILRLASDFNNLRLFYGEFK